MLNPRVCCGCDGLGQAQADAIVSDVWMGTSNLVQLLRPSIECVMIVIKISSRRLNVSMTLYKVNEGTPTSTFQKP